MEGIRGRRNGTVTRLLRKVVIQWWKRCQAQLLNFPDTRAPFATDLQIATETAHGILDRSQLQYRELHVST